MQPLQEEEEEEDAHGGDGDGGQEKGSEKNFEEAPKESKGGGLSSALKSLFRCTTCSSLLPPPAPLYQVCAPYQVLSHLTRFNRFTKCLP